VLRAELHCSEYPGRGGPPALKIAAPSTKPFINFLFKFITYHLKMNNQHSTNVRTKIDATQSEIASPGASDDFDRSMGIEISIERMFKPYATVDTPQLETLMVRGRRISNPFFFSA
jgi:hypothetical protein